MVGLGGRVGGVGGLVVPVLACSLQCIAPSIVHGLIVCPGYHPRGLSQQSLVSSHLCVWRFHPLWVYHAPKVSPILPSSDSGALCCGTSALLNDRYHSTTRCPLGDVLPCCVPRAEHWSTLLPSFSVCVVASHTTRPATVCVFHRPTVFGPRCAASNVLPCSMLCGPARAHCPRLVLTLL